MYIIKKQKIKYKLLNKNDLKELDGFLFGRKTHKICGFQLKDLIICNRKIARTIVKMQVIKKYNKLIRLLTELLVSDDESGESYREALNQIEKFRLIIKNKYREYLSRKDLEFMSKKLTMLKKESDKKIIELNNVYQESMSRTSYR